MRPTLLMLSLLTASACAGSRAPEPYPAVAAEDSVVRDVASAVEAVRTHLEATSDLAQFDFGTAEAQEGPGEWWVEVPYRTQSGEVRLPSGAGFRVSKASGAVDVPYPRR